MRHDSLASCVDRRLSKCVRGQGRSRSDFMVDAKARSLEIHRAAEAIASRLRNQGLQ
jgi:hypothetical protein